MPGVGPRALYGQKALRCCLCGCSANHTRIQWGFRLLGTLWFYTYNALVERGKAPATLSTYPTGKCRVSWVLLSTTGEWACHLVFLCWTWATGNGDAGADERQRPSQYDVCRQARADKEACSLSALGNVYEDGIIVSLVACGQKHRGNNMMRFLWEQERVLKNKLVPTDRVPPFQIPGWPVCAVLRPVPVTVCPTCDFFFLLLEIVIRSQLKLFFWLVLPGSWWAVIL